MDFSILSVPVESDCLEFIKIIVTLFFALTIDFPQFCENVLMKILKNIIKTKINK